MICIYIYLSRISNNFFTIMKKIKITLLLIMSILSIESFGDIIITKSAQPDVAVRIANMDDFPDIDLIIVYECVATERVRRAWEPIDSFATNFISPSCPALICAVKKDYLKHNSFDKNDANIIKSNISINAKTYSNPDNKILMIDMHFEILGFDDSSLVLHNKMHSSHYYESGKRATIEEFKYDGDASNLRKSFW